MKSLKTMTEADFYEAPHIHGIYPPALDQQGRNSEVEAPGDDAVWKQLAGWALLICGLGMTWLVGWGLWELTMLVVEMMP